MSLPSGGSWRWIAAQASLAVKRSLQPEEISLYVGIPFCPTRCAYCSFISASGSANRLIPAYLDALFGEIDAGRGGRPAGGEDGADRLHRRRNADDAGP